MFNRLCPLSPNHSKWGLVWPFASLSLSIALTASVQAATYVGVASASSPLIISQGTTDRPADYSALSGGASASLTMGAAHGGTATAQADSGGSGLAEATATIYYNFVVAGAADEYVPVRVPAEGWAEGGGDWFEGYARLRIDGALGSTGLYQEVFAAQGFYGHYNEFTVDRTLYLLSNSTNTVSMSAEAIGGNGAYLGWAQAFVDPIFTIDPAYADRFKLEGVPEAPAGVPEPAAWVMMIVGFGVVGVALRRREPLQRSRRQAMSPRQHMTASDRIWRNATGLLKN